MKTSRISHVLSAAAIFFASSVFSSLSFAQQPVETQAAPQLYPKRSLRPASLPFEIIGSVSIRMDFNGVGPPPPYDTGVNILNTSSDPITVYFSRTQRLPPGWSTSVCWGQTCFASTTDSQVFTIPPASSASLTLDLTPALSEYPDSSTVWLRAGVVGSPADTVQLVFYGGFVPASPPLIFVWGSSKFQYSFFGSGPHSVSNEFENLSAYQTQYYFSMQDSLPQNWSLQYCVSDSCTAGSNVSRTVEGYSLDSLYSQKVNFKLQVPVLRKKDSAIIYLSVHPKTENPADSANYRFVAVINTHSLTGGITAHNFTTYPFTAGKISTITAQFKNLLTIPDSYRFSVMTAFPAGWSLQNYCVGDSCTSGAGVTSQFDSAGGTNAIQNIVFTLQTQSLTQADTGILYLSSYPADNPGDLRIDTLYAVANPQSGVAANSSETSAGLAVTNAWPNPVYGSGKLTLDILTDLGGPCKARFYDIAGVEQASVDLGTLHAGANEVQIASPNLHGGEYIIRIGQGNDASEIIRITYIR